MKNKLTLFSLISLMLLFIGCNKSLLAQNNSKKIEPINQSSNATPINQFNNAKQKHGIWYEQFEALRGEPGYHYFGNYINGKKEGLWYKMDFNGNVLNIEMFQNNVRNGIAQYFENGKLICTGNWRGLNPKYEFDTVLVVDPITEDHYYVAVPSEKGSVEHGIWRYYDARSGQLVKEIDYQVGYIISSTNFEIKSKLDSTSIQNIERNLPHNKKIYYKPPSGKGRKL